MSIVDERTEKGAAVPRSLTAVIDYAVVSHGRAVAVLLVLCMLAFLPCLLYTSDAADE